MKHLVLLTLLTCAACAQTGSGGDSIPFGMGAQTCAPGHVQPNFARLESELKAARTRWKAARIQNYGYDFARIAAPVRYPNVRVKVVRGRITDIAPQNPLENIDTDRLHIGPVEALFSEIARAITYQRNQPCADLRVTYNAADGHPTTFYSGSRFSPQADGSAEWRVTNFSARP
ncbi:DUF6174 domain-containing protein [Deinococcus arenicola]|uniref:DUF6174 domain-containing protein n=1 Tax=Deinococcus arenicola TaxID=2994950 RepID=A0ABU4DUY5_9DEIO|nr:DUF6174 domain-containing protein [Deinococcus sp. ZS9-10]MDV6375499.1 DUF6174 domain-containing protein [Deinococcus sp. ZS9-10]